MMKSHNCIEPMSRPKEREGIKFSNLINAPLQSSPISSSTQHRMGSDALRSEFIVIYAAQTCQSLGLNALGIDIGV
jgi:hypothetical protein